MEKRNKKLILEGGLSGHMSHLYDNGDLTFAQLKDIFAKASHGELKGTEKTDGQNLFVSYSVKDGKAKAARNKGNIKAGGMDAAALASKFAGRGDLTKVFVEAFDAFERAIESLSVEDQIEIFGEDAEIYFNAELMDPRSPNVVNYDTKTLVIHQKGHGRFDKETSAKVEDASENVKRLQSALEQVQDQESKEGYSVQINAIRGLEALSDDVALKNAYAALDKITSEDGLNNNSTITEYMVARLVPVVASTNTPQSTQKDVLRRLLKLPGGKTLPQLVKNLNPEQKAAVRAVVKDKSLLSRAIFPLEQIVHDFSVKMLEGLESAFVVDSQKEVSRLRQEVSAAIKTIEASGNEEAIEVLQKQMAKLKAAQNVSTAAEGFVFDYDGHTYKFTGNFAPINQILGLFKYGKGSIPPLMKETDVLTEDQGIDIAVVPGAFKPPHRGHLAMIQAYANMAKRVVIFMSPLPRKMPDGKSVSFEDARKVWDRYLKAYGLADQVTITESPVNSPVGASFHFIQNEDENPDWAQPGETVVLGVSTKGGDQERFSKNAERHAREGVTVLAGEEYSIDPSGEEFTDSRNGEALSASTMRKAISENDIEAFTEYLPIKVRDQADEILSQLSPPHQASETIYEIINEVLEENIRLFSDSKINQEPNYVNLHNAGSPHKEKNMTIIDRKKFIQQHREHLELREVISKAVGKVLRERKTRIAEEERQLRKVIRELLTETAINDEVPSRSTGINVLEDLLKKIIPVLEDHYKQLTTSATQRESFRSHVINAVQNTLAPTKASQDASASGLEDQAGLEDIPLDELEVEVGADEEGVDDDQFIDIDARHGLDDLGQFGDIPGDADEATGRNFAINTFEKVENQIVDAYGLLENDEDRELFYDYLVTNIKLYFDKFEDELSDILPEPTTPEYEEEKEEQIEFEGEI